MIFVLGMTRPSFVERCRSCKPHFPVDYQNAPVRPPISAIQSPGDGRMVIGEFATGFPEHPDVRIIEGPTRADPIKKKTDLDSSLSPLTECITKLMTDVIGSKDIRCEVHGMLGGANGIQHCGKIFVTIGEQLDLVTRHWDWVTER